MSDPMLNNSDKIMVRKPDGSFEVVTIEREAKVPEVTNVKPAEAKPEEMEKLIRTKDFYKKDEIKKSQKKPIAKPTVPTPPPAPASDPAVFTWDNTVLEVVNILPDEIKNPQGKDEKYLDRLKSIILSRLRDVRDWLGTKEALTKDVESGGLSLKETQAAVVLNTIESQYKKIHSQPIPKVAEAPSPFGADVTDLYKPQETLNALVEADVPTGVNDNYQTMLAGFIDKGGDDAGVKPETVSVAKEVEMPTPPADNEKKVVPDLPAAPPATPPVKPPLPQVQASAKPVRAQAEENSKPSLTDIKPKRRLVGPVEELKNMTLQDFRRLAANTDERLNRVVEIILGLEEESFANKVLGIKGWRQSPLYKKYLAIGNKSLMQNMSVEEVIASLGQVSEDELTLEEFNKITDFNKKLRY